MRRALLSLAVIVGLGSLLPVASADAENPPIPFGDARLKIEYNATDGDAGLQIFADAEPWQFIRVTNPDGRTVAEFTSADVIRNYGLTELFSESSEPPFTEFPFSKFKELFPAGRYTFTGRTVEGQRLRSTFRLSHVVPDAARITSPADDAVVAASDFEVTWRPVTSPSEVQIAAYQVLVTEDADLAPGQRPRVLDVVLPADARSFAVPAEFVRSGPYKIEVLAVERNGNQTLREVAVTVA